MSYLTEPRPPHGVAEIVAPGIRRIVAANPGPMTYHGTNTFLVDRPRGLLVIDPGPDDSAHLAALTQAAGGRASAILLTHGHSDHCGGAARLAEALGVPVHGFTPFRSDKVKIDVGLAEGDEIGGLRVLHTPGHAADHICLARDDGLVFTGDHVMGWSSSVVPYPSGDMAAYVHALEHLRDRNDRLYLPGHGPALADPAKFVGKLIGARLFRERQILELLEKGVRSAAEITEKLYATRGPRLMRAAEHNVRAHVAKLLGEGRIAPDAVERLIT